MCSFTLFQCNIVGKNRGRGTLDSAVNNCKNCSGLNQPVVGLKALLVNVAQSETGVSAVIWLGLVSFQRERSGGWQCTFCCEVKKARSHQSPCSCSSKWPRVYCMASAQPSGVDSTVCNVSKCVCVCVWINWNIRGKNLWHNHRRRWERLRGGKYKAFHFTDVMAVRHQALGVILDDDLNSLIYFYTMTATFS